MRRGLWILGATAAVLVGPAAAATPAAASQTPAQFVAGVFASYNNPNAPQGAADVYDPVLDKLIDDNRALAGKTGQVDLDADPICQCQDTGGHYVYVSGAAGADGLFDAKVADDAAADGGPPPWTFVLKLEAGGWRIYDVIDQTGSNRTWLARHNACMRKFTAEARLSACFDAPS